MTIRSFIAVDPSPEVTSHIAHFIKDLEPRTKGVRWIPPEGVHLTLRFLGGVGEDVLELVKVKLEQLATQGETIRLSASGVGFFPHPSRPRIVWVGLEGETDKLEKLQRRVEEAVQDLPIHQEKGKGFKPHLTIARIPDAQKISGLAPILEAAKSTNFGDFEVEGLILYKSDLTPRGSRYTKLKIFKLGRSDHGDNKPQ